MHCYKINVEISPFYYILLVNTESELEKTAVLSSGTSKLIPARQVTFHARLLDEQGHSQVVCQKDITRAAALRI